MRIGSCAAIHAYINFILVITIADTWRNAKLSVDSFSLPANVATSSSSRLVRGPSNQINRHRSAFGDALNTYSLTNRISCASTNDDDSVGDTHSSAKGVKNEQVSSFHHGTRSGFRNLFGCKNRISRIKKFRRPSRKKILTIAATLALSINILRSPKPAYADSISSSADGDTAVVERYTSNPDKPKEEGATSDDGDIASNTKEKKDEFDDDDEYGLEDDEYGIEEDDDHVDDDEKPVLKKENERKGSNTARKSDRPPRPVSRKVKGKFETRLNDKRAERTGKKAATNISKAKTGNTLFVYGIVPLVILKTIHEFFRSRKEAQRVQKGFEFLEEEKQKYLEEKNKKEDVSEIY